MYACRAHYSTDSVIWLSLFQGSLAVKACLKNQKSCLFAHKHPFPGQKSSSIGRLTCGFSLKRTHSRQKSVISSIFKQALIEERGVKGSAQNEALIRRFRSNDYGDFSLACRLGSKKPLRHAMRPILSYPHLGLLFLAFQGYTGRPLPQEKSAADFRFEKRWSFQINCVIILKRLV